MDQSNNPPDERERNARILLVGLSALLVAFAVWCAVLFWRAQSFRHDLDSHLASIEEVHRLRGELDRLNGASPAALALESRQLTRPGAERLLERRGDPELLVALSSLDRALDRLDERLAEAEASPDSIWEAAVTARSALAALEGRLQAQVSDLHRRLGDLWTGLNLLIVASLLLAGSNLALLRLAHRRRRKLEEAHAQALRRSTQDPLTGVWNREAILRLLRRELARAERLRSPIGVILVDIDGFQQVNVLLGQDQGDFILEQLAESLGSFVRPYDTMGRFGGDSFLIVLPVCDETATGNVADRLREAINEHDMEHALGRIRVTLSLAYTAVENAEGTDGDLLIHRLQDRIESLQKSGPGQVARLAAN
ncbi:MAG: GGDEF domain-containing protein [Acidobacteriota bacterium]